MPESYTMTKLCDLCWAAGVVDGEGCITISRQRGGAGGRINVHHRLYLKVTMGHKPTVERLRSILGVGSIQEQRSTKGHNTAWSLWIGGNQAADTIRRLRPFLFTKSAEADVALEFAVLPRHLVGGRDDNRKRLPASLIAKRESCFERLRDLKPSARFRVATQPEAT